MLRKRMSPSFNFLSSTKTNLNKKPERRIACQIRQEVISDLTLVVKHTYTPLIGRPLAFFTFLEQQHL